MPPSNLKEGARLLIDRLPDEATSEDLLHQIDLHPAVEAGLEASREGRTFPLEEVRRRLGLEN